MLKNRLPALAPGVDPTVVIDTGATEIRSSFPADVVPGIVAAYSEGMRGVFATVAAYAGVAVFFAAGNSWKKLNLGK